MRTQQQESRSGDAHSESGRDEVTRAIAVAFIRYLIVVYVELATPDQQLQLEQRILPLLDELKRTGSTQLIDHAARDIMGSQWKWKGGYRW